jgi:exopolyphosphatase/guanosine-5'-triphosphate,3'-diphosphate pyrophosphatase
MKIAVIDLGTNTFHLLIGESTKQGYREITRKQIYVQLGQGGMNNAIISPEAQQRALKAMVEIKELIDRHHIQHVHAVATSAIRNAHNGPSLVAGILELTGIQVHIISGNQESILIHQGVKASFAIGPARALIMDIGGGSVEFIISDKQEALWQTSFEIGVQRLLERFNENKLISAEAITRLHAYLEVHLQPLFQALAIYKPTRLVGTSGAFTTLVSMHQIQTKNQQTLAESVIYKLPREYIYQTYARLRAIHAKGQPQLAECPHMAIVSNTLIDFVLRKSCISDIVVSTYSLRMGVFLQAIEHLSSKSTR